MTEGNTNAKEWGTAEPVTALTALVARQPILDTAGQTIGYELLFRAAHEQQSNYNDGNQATLATIANSLLAIGFDRLTDGKVAFVNMTGQLLDKEIYHVLPPQRTVIELLEAPAVSDDLIATCQQARAMGYKVALDDVIELADVGPLFPHVDIIKVDCLGVQDEKRRALYAAARERGVSILAEKVESLREKQECEALGARYFQGYYFAKPVILEGRRLAGSELDILQLMKAVNDEACDFDYIGKLIKHNAVLSYQFLRYLNSAAMGIRRQVTSIKQGLTLLGRNPLRKWVMLLSLTCLSRAQARQLLLNCVVRARACEKLAAGEGLVDRQLDCFFIGLLSGFEAVMGMPLAQLLPQTGLAQDVQEVLLGEPQASFELSRLWSVVQACEQGDWGTVMESSLGMHQSQSDIAMGYYEAMDWANQVAG